MSENLPIWPYAIRKSGNIGVTGGPQRNVASFQPAVGPAIERRRSSIVNKTYSVTFTNLSIDERNAFVDFYENTLKSGSLPFKWVDPMTDTGNKIEHKFDDWELVDTSFSKFIRDVIWIEELGLFVAVGISGTGDRVITSPDGENWTLRESASDNSWNSLVWSPELRLIVAVAFGGDSNRIMTSPDGINWTAVNQDGGWFGVTWSPELGLFVAVGSINEIGHSSDGVNWTIVTPPEDYSWIDVVWSPELGLFTAVSSNGTNRSMYSSDGINWTMGNLGALAAWRDIAWSPELGLFVVVPINTSYISYSSDGINWTNILPNTNNIDLWGLTWAKGVNKFIAVGHNGSGVGQVLTSSDGVNWTERESPSTADWTCVAFSPELGVAVALADSGADEKIMISKDEQYAQKVRFRAKENQGYIETRDDKNNYTIEFEITLLK